MYLNSSLQFSMFNLLRKFQAPRKINEGNNSI